MRNKKGYWTYEKCKEEALKYNTKTEFQKNGKGAYQSSKRNNWYDDICSHMDDEFKRDKNYGYWTYEKCKEEALKYDKLIDFKLKSLSAYGKICKKGWYKELTKHMDKTERKENGYWTYEKCKKEALKYNTKNDIKKKSGTCYKIILEMIWLELFNHMPNRYYTYSFEDCKNEALKFNNRTEFRNNSGSIFRCAVKNDWIDDICSHMIKKGNRFLRCIYCAEFDDKHVYVGLTYNYKKRISEHINIKDIKKSSVYRYMKETNKKPKFKKLTEYMDVNKASILEGEILNEYIDNGWVKINKNKCGGVGGSI